MEDIQEQWQVDRVFSPEMTSEKREELSKGWKRSVGAACSGSLEV
jgi:glycerol kinase